jgi:hypothetical protein
MVLKNFGALLGASSGVCEMGRLEEAFKVQKEGDDFG